MGRARAHFQEASLRNTFSRGLYLLCCQAVTWQVGSFSHDTKRGLTLCQRLYLSLFIAMIYCHVIALCFGAWCEFLPASRTIIQEDIVAMRDT